MSKKILFVCDRFPMLQMVMERDRTAIIGGDVIRTPHRTIGFRKTPYGGQYETDQQDIIEYIRSSPQFETGDIIEVADITQLRGGKDISQQVVAGMVTSAPRESPMTAPTPAPAGDKGVAPARGPARSSVF